MTINCSKENEYICYVHVCFVQIFVHLSLPISTDHLTFSLTLVIFFFKVPRAQKEADEDSMAENGASRLSLHLPGSGLELVVEGDGQGLLCK